MPTVDVLNLQGKKVGTKDLDAKVFGVDPNKALVHEAVVMQGASARQGTASTKRRGEVSGSGKKPWKQKHTGRARAGSVRSPIWRHGGSVFGPKPRGYGFSLPKKKYRAALRSAISSKLSDGEVVVVSDLSIEQPKTKLLAKLLHQMGLKKKTLIVLGEAQVDVERAGRNLQNVKIVRPHELNVYDILLYDSVVIPEGELGRLQEVWS